MSSGQKPRRRAYFPHMKERGRGRRRRGVRIVLWDGNFRAVWPPVLHVDGRAIRVDLATLTINGRVLDNRTGFWTATVETE